MRLFSALALVAALGPTALAETEPSPPSPREQVEAVIKDHMTEFRECYTKRAKIKTTLAGKLVVLITIEAKGNVSAAHVTQSLDDEVDACVSKVMKTLTFPAPGEQVKLKYPFDFHK
jgi:outer membrane biosynthesis protein TonB